jgi:hypothetical protein
MVEVLARLGLRRRGQPDPVSAQTCRRCSTKSELAWPGRILSRYPVGHLRTEKCASVQCRRAGGACNSIASKSSIVFTNAATFSELTSAVFLSRIRSRLRKILPNVGRPAVLEQCTDRQLHTVWNWLRLRPNSIPFSQVRRFATPISQSAIPFEFDRLTRTYAAEENIHIDAAVTTGEQIRYKKITCLLACIRTVNRDGHWINGFDSYIAHTRENTVWQKPIRIDWPRTNENGYRFAFGVKIPR